MDTVGVRELKAHLSRHLRRVRSGVRLAVTDRGRTIATISPVDQPAGVDWAHELVATGKATWSGGKPRGNATPPTVGRGRAVSDAVIEDRR